MTNTARQHLSAAAVNGRTARPEPRGVSFTLRLAGLTGLVVSATLATAVGSTTITQLVLAATGLTSSPPTTRPATTQPAFAAARATTQPAALAIVPVQTPPAHVRALIDPAALHPVAANADDIAGLGIESHFSGDAQPAAGSTHAVSIATGGGGGGGGGSSQTAAAIRDAFAGDLNHLQPVTFGGSPDLADAYQAFRTQSINDSGYDAPEPSVSDAVPALGMDTPGDPKPGDSKTDASKPTIHRTPRRINSLPSVTDSLPSDGVIAARPNGEFSPAHPGRAIDPFDGGGRSSTIGAIPGTGIADDGYGVGSVSDAPGEVLTPEPGTLLSLAGVLALVGRRRRARCRD